MTERIKKLAEMTTRGELYIEHTDTEYKREDLFLSPTIMNAKRASEYILNQKPYVSELTALTGYLRFQGDVMGDIFNRNGHESFRKAMNAFYAKPVEGLCTFEWQHSVADFEKVIRVGITGLKDEISKSKQKHTDKDSLEFLEAIDIIADSIIGWANKCSRAAFEMSLQVNSEEARTNLAKLSEALRNVPKNPAKTFYEAVLTVYVIYAFVPDSIGCIDRYLYPFYVKDIADGTLTKADARSYLQELFLMLQARISINSDRFYRGGESHFCIGGYTEDGEDGFNELSRLVIEAMLELPTWIPQISLRWTKKTPTEVLRYIMDLERKDPNKRIAFVNDEPRIKMLTEYAGFPYSVACRYTMAGCNEPQLPGGIFMDGAYSNLAKAIESTLYGRKDIYEADSFDKFYAIFEEELSRTLDKIRYYYDGFQKIRARDQNLVSTMFFEGSIDRARSITQGGASNTVSCIGLMGLTTVIDSLAIIRQFVYDEKRITMRDLTDALTANWEGFENLRRAILRDGKFFGNNLEVSNDCADKLSESIHRFLEDKRTDFGYKYVTGTLIGYNQHNKWFGDVTGATPDGRYNGDIISFGIGQSEGRDREGLTSLLTSVAKLTGKHSILCGSSVTNILIEKQLVTSDDSFERLVLLMETYFKMGGLHFQLNYVSKDDLINAQITPEKYKSLRVRVSGFSDYFVFLENDMQNELITRTEKTN